MPNTLVPQLITPGVMAEMIGVSVRRVQYILNTRQHIRPVARAGTLRLYDQKAVELVKQEVVDANAASRGGAA